MKSGEDFNDAIAKTSDFYEKRSKDGQYRLDQLKAEFDDFKERNNLDSLFTRGMDVPTCKRILDHMKDLMIESDWHIVNKDTVNLQQSQDVKK